MNDKYLNFKNEIERLIIELRSIFEKNDIQSKLENYNHLMLEDGSARQIKISENYKRKKLFEDLTNSYNHSVNQIED